MTNLGISLKYQFETIKQFDATQDVDNGYFRIGGLSPSLFFDNRDRVVNPRSGNYHGLSLELANPSLLSMEEDELEVNFLKFVSRNKFYYSFNGITLATALSVGYQRNLADGLVQSDNGDIVLDESGRPKTVGYIPSVKVFRLEGIDGVRGFAEDEINRLESGQDILDNIVQDDAYFVSAKLEIRRQISESLLSAYFIDAGRLFVSDFKPLDLRVSTGISFKFLTPVGTLDFDYGLKIRRHRYSGGARERFGRFHLAIGFF